MKKLLFLVCTLCLFSGTAAAGMFASVEDRASAVQASVEGNNSYNAHMARGLSAVAEDEKSQMERNAARAFMDEAEKYARQAVGEK